MALPVRATEGDSDQQSYSDLAGDDKEYSETDHAACDNLDIPGSSHEPPQVITIVSFRLAFWPTPLRRLLDGRFDCRCEHRPGGGSGLRGHLAGSQWRKSIAPTRLRQEPTLAGGKIFFPLPHFRRSGRLDQSSFVGGSIGGSSILCHAVPCSKNKIGSAYQR